MTNNASQGSSYNKSPDNTGSQIKDRLIKAAGGTADVINVIETAGMSQFLTDRANEKYAEIRKEHPGIFGLTKENDGKEGGLGKKLANSVKYGMFGFFKKDEIKNDYKNVLESKMYEARENQNLGEKAEKSDADRLLVDVDSARKRADVIYSMADLQDEKKFSIGKDKVEKIKDGDVDKLRKVFLNSLKAAYEENSDLSGEEKEKKVNEIMNKMMKDGLKSGNGMIISANSEKKLKAMMGVMMDEGYINKGVYSESEAKEKQKSAITEAESAVDELLKNSVKTTVNMGVAEKGYLTIKERVADGVKQVLGGGMIGSVAGATAGVIAQRTMKHGLKTALAVALVSTGFGAAAVAGAGLGVAGAMAGISMANRKLSKMKMDVALGRVTSDEKSKEKNDKYVVGKMSVGEAIDELEKALDEKNKIGVRDGDMIISTYDLNKVDLESLAGIGVRMDNNGKRGVGELFEYDGIDNVEQQKLELMQKWAEARKAMDVMKKNEIGQSSDDGGLFLDKYEKEYKRIQKNLDNEVELKKGKRRKLVLRYAVTGALIGGAAGGVLSQTVGRNLFGAKLSNGEPVETKDGDVSEEEFNKMYGNVNGNGKGKVSSVERGNFNKNVEYGLSDSKLIDRGDIYLEGGTKIDVYGMSKGYNNIFDPAYAEGKEVPVAFGPNYAKFYREMLGSGLDEKTAAAKTFEEVLKGLGGSPEQTALWYEMLGCDKAGEINNFVDINAFADKITSDYWKASAVSNDLLNTLAQKMQDGSVEMVELGKSGENGSDGSYMVASTYFKGSKILPFNGNLQNHLGTVMRLLDKDGNNVLALTEENRNLFGVQPDQKCWLGVRTDCGGQVVVVVEHSVPQGDEPENGWFMENFEFYKNNTGASENNTISSGGSSGGHNNVDVEKNPKDLIENQTPETPKEGGGKIMPTPTEKLEEESPLTEDPEKEVESEVLDGKNPESVIENQTPETPKEGGGKIMPTPTEKLEEESPLTEDPTLETDSQEGVFRIPHDSNTHENLSSEPVGVRANVGDVDNTTVYSEGVYDTDNSYATIDVADNLETEINSTEAVSDMAAENDVNIAGRSVGLDNQSRNEYFRRYFLNEDEEEKLKNNDKIS